MKLADKGGKQISPLLILIIIIALIVLVAWRSRTRTTVAKDGHAAPRVSAQCKVCGHDNPPEARFCGNCGAALVTAVEPPPPAAVPSPPPAAEAMAVEYMGFGIRFGAALIDGVIVSIITGVLFGLTLTHWSPFPMFWSLPLLLLYHWLFTGLMGQTPGKMAFGIKVVNVQGDRPGLGVAALREFLGKLISTIVLCLGFFWIDRDKQKQGWHDKIAGTHVVKVVKVESRREEEEL